MPGKHAPESPASFILSVGRAVAGALVVLGVVAVIAIAATGSSKKPTAKSSTPPVTVTRTTHPPTSSPSTQPASPTPTATATASTAPKVTVNVLNGTTKNGIAHALATKLTAEGYLVKTVATEPKRQTVTTIYYRPGEKAAADALLAAHPELGKVATAIASTPTNAMLTIILGDDYKAA